jgi:triacylglycerol lipase
MNRSTRYDRIHIVLVPGFGAFDALGRVEYYSGITTLFRDWRRQNDLPVTLHYFDNLPSAAVTTRATRLRMYLAKRMARGEILENDAIILVGHSTGGLDIRQLICDLHKPENKQFHVDSGYIATSRQIRHRLKGVVFLSVPHWGTNIADWVYSHPALRAAIIADLRAAVAGSQVGVLDAIETEITGGAASLTDAELLLALKDALTEANEHYGPPGPLRSAEAQEAFSELSLYFRQMWSDFDVIHDLTCEPHDFGRISPAHFNKRQRKEELKLWEDPPIRIVSYATVGGRLFSFPPGGPAPVWEPISPCSFAGTVKDFWLSTKNDLSYRLCYQACAGGPFCLPKTPRKISRVVGHTPPLPLETWDNDGIVNTASMFWPEGDTVLVVADHLDIVGHYKLRKAPHGKKVEVHYQAAREYRSYDCLQSTPRFTRKLFEEIWTGIFDFAANSSRRAQRPRLWSKPKKLSAAA